MKLYTLGYGQWPTKHRIDRMVQALKDTGVTTLVDIRHSPCSASLDPTSNYGPRDWNLRMVDRGIAYYLEHEGIEYIWLVELGNPQKNDPDMGLLQDHIVSADEKWPVNRGLKLLHQFVQTEGKRCCLLCACKSYDECHRKVIAEALRDRFFAGELEICHP